MNLPRSLFFSLLVWSLGLHAAEDQPPVQVPPVPPAVQAPAVPVIEPSVPPEDLKAQLPKVPSIVMRDGAVWWQDGTHAVKVVAIDVGREGAPLVETAIGRLAVSRKLIGDPSPTPPGLAALGGLVERAKTAGLPIEELQLTEGILTGVHLRAPSVIVHADGVLRKTEVSAVERRDDRERVVAAAERLVRALPTTSFDELGRKCIEDSLRRLYREDGNEEADEVPPSFARRAVRFGWLRPFFPEDKEAVAAMEKAVVEAERFLPVQSFTGDKMQLAMVKNAFTPGDGPWIITTASRSAYTMDHDAPLYYWSLGKPPPKVVVDLPPGSDPTVVNTVIGTARMYQNGHLLAEWKDGKMRADLRQAWRSAIPAKGHKDITPNAVADFLPPHIVVTGINGDVIQLITEGGALLPPQDASPAEGERFLADAAKILADPARLDLLGEYLLRYVHDSPDSRFPFLMGKRECKGDIHQTTLQTLATVTGGLMRGDCDDLSEVYETIADRQGRNAQVVSLPRHAAAAFSEKKDDGAWHTYVLQTGPPLEFTDAKLPNSLAKAFASFDESAPFDPNCIPLLLRFSGENTRGQWRLSYRIFAEPDYARTMMDVQRDWQYQTYQRAINKMRKLIDEKNDQDNANYRELSGLYSFTGQYARAVEVQQEAIQRTEDPEGKLQLAVELILHQFEAKQPDAARATALDILDRQMPALRQGPGEKEKTEAKLANIGQELVAALVHGKAWDLALRTLKDTQMERMAKNIEEVSAWIASPRFNQKMWSDSPQLEQLRRQMAMFATIGIAVLEGTGPGKLKNNGDLKTLARAVENWLAQVAFHDVDDEEDPLMRYASAGRYYTAIFGEDAFGRLLDQAEAPSDNRGDHANRLGGPAQMPIDLPWISISVPFWTMRMMELFERDRVTLKRDVVAQIGKRSAAAFEACRKLGLESSRFDHQAHLVALITSLIGRDANVVRERLRWVKNKNDKKLRDDTAQWIGDTARFLDLDWFNEVLAIWQDELDYKPKYFWIAWRAALNGAPEHALMAAKRAAERFKDDPSFAEEFQFMQQLFPAGAGK